MSSPNPIIEFFEQNYRNLLKLTIMMSKDKDIAYDILHNVAVVIYSRQDQLFDVENPAAYLALCIRRAVINYFRDKAKALPTDPTLIEETEGDMRNQVALDYVEWIIIVERHLEAFSPRMRKAFIAHYIDDRPIEQLSKELGMTPNALSQQFKRMRAKILDRSPNMMLHIMILSTIK